MPQVTARVWQTGFLALLAAGLLAGRADAQLRFSPELLAEANSGHDIPAELSLSEELPEPGDVGHPG